MRPSDAHAFQGSCRVVSRCGKPDRGAKDRALARRSRRSMIVRPDLERTRSWDRSLRFTVREFLPPLCRQPSATPSPAWPRAKGSAFILSASNMSPVRTPLPGLARRTARRGRSRATKPTHAAETGFASGPTTPGRRSPPGCRRSRSSRARTFGARRAAETTAVATRARPRFGAPGRRSPAGSRDP